MRVHVVSDVHGNSEALARAGDGADALVVLGDLLDFVDYHDHSKGILGAIFGPEKVAVFAELRRQRRSPALSAYIRSLWAGLEDAASVVEEAVREQYSRLFAAMSVSAPTYVTPGNVDMPSLWPEFVDSSGANGSGNGNGGGVHVLDGEATEIGGLRFGFVGGALLPDGVTLRRNGVWKPYLRSESDYAASVAGLPDVDVLCSHIPPSVPELTYDVVARRPEFGSRALLDLIRERRPRWSVFGHVHQPLAPRMRIGRTECVNVGHFQRTGVAYTLRW